MATSVELLPIETSGVAGRRPPKATFRLKNIETDGKAISWKHCCVEWVFAKNGQIKAKML